MWHLAYRMAHCEVKRVNSFPMQAVDYLAQVAQEDRPMARVFSGCYDILDAIEFSANQETDEPPKPEQVLFVQGYRRDWQQLLNLLMQAHRLFAGLNCSSDLQLVLAAEKVKHSPALTADLAEAKLHYARCEPLLKAMVLELFDEEHWRRFWAVRS